MIVFGERVDIKFSSEDVTLELRTVDVSAGSRHGTEHGTGIDGTAAISSSSSSSACH